MDPAALRAFGIHEDPRAAIKRVFGYGDELREEMEEADAFTAIVRGYEDDSLPGEDGEAPPPPEPSPVGTTGGQPDGSKAE